MPKDDHSTFGTINDDKDIPDNIRYAGAVNPNPDSKETNSQEKPSTQASAEPAKEQDSSDKKPSSNHDKNVSVQAPAKKKMINEILQQIM